jgi:DNA mismatch repair ATPase MutS
MAICYELDALVSLADATHKHGLVMPIIETGPTAISASELVHPLLEHPVGNPLALDQAGRVLFLTGPNMAGKTTYLRAILTALYFAHLGMGVPAKAFSFVPVQRLLTSISLSDNLADGISFFRAEALRGEGSGTSLGRG